MSAAIIVGLTPFWLSSPLSIGQFSLAFTLPFILAAWAYSKPAPRYALASALAGTAGKGLWIESLCIGIALLFGWASMLVSPEPERAFRVILPMTYGICALFILTRLPQLSARRYVYALMFAGVGVTAAGLMMAQAAPTRDWVMLGYRFKGFFENANQLALAIVAFAPIMLALILNARTALVKALCAGGLAVFLYAIILSGTKTGLAIALASGCALCLYHAGRTGSLGRALFSLGLVLALIAISIPLVIAILSWASPIAFEKINAIFAGGVWDYQSIRSRNILWEESVRIGISSPLIGEGAGARILGRSHSHNMIIDYFRGMGVFGMASAAVLLIATAARTVAYFSSTWRKGRQDRALDTMVMGFYLGALGYLLGNQISDSFSPSTAFAFWMVYICAYLSSQHQIARSRPPRPKSAARWSSAAIQPKPSWSTPRTAR